MLQITRDNELAHQEGENSKQKGEQEQEERTTETGAIQLYQLVCAAHPLVPQLPSPPHGTRRQQRARCGP